MERIDTAVAPMAPAPGVVWPRPGRALAASLAFCACFAFGCASDPGSEASGHPSGHEAVRAATALGPITSCAAVGRARPVCGFQNPEDLVALPGGQAVLVSEYGAMDGSRPGLLSVLALSDDARTPVFRGGDARGGPRPGWGSPACPGPPSPAFSPHGIHLSRRSDGALQLLVVQHGGRESIEFFEVVGAGARFDAQWRGCVVAPRDAWLNSVAALPGGGFVTTNMMSRALAGDDLQKAFLSGSATGQVLEWLPGNGFRVIPGSRSAMPNGIETSADGRLLFVNASGENEVRRVVRATGEIEARASVPSLDNARWAPDGRLLVASILAHGMEDFGVCMALERGACPMEFQIVAVDPHSMETEVLYRNRGAPMGGGTVGLQVGKELFIGSFAGDRVLRVQLD